MRRFIVASVLVLAAALSWRTPLFPILAALAAIVLLALFAKQMRGVLRSLWRGIAWSARERAIADRDASTPSPLEELLARELAAQRMPYEREYAISRMRVDFAFPASKLAVECDGWRYHHSFLDRRRDARRDAYLKRMGWRVLRFSGDRIRSDVKGCVRQIADAL